MQNEPLVCSRQRVLGAGLRREWEELMCPGYTTVWSKGGSSETHRGQALLRGRVSNFRHTVWI